ncbi:hypothetical protein [Cohnella sp. 56]|uniref:hypothetical protein n=1 Tax=Cohnella sp. 56 TaxID=3113722 RepID=UPI0030EAFCEE
MTAIRPVYVYQLTPEQLAAVDAGGVSIAGLQFGEPIRIEQPDSIIKRIDIEIMPQKRKGPPKKAFVSYEQYLQLRNTGFTRLEICAKYDIRISLLKRYLTTWGIGSKTDEAAAMRQAK